MLSEPEGVDLYIKILFSVHGSIIVVMSEGEMGKNWKGEEGWWALSECIK